MSIDTTPFYNSRGELVGNILDNEIYYTERDKSKSQIFSKKNYFEGQHIPNGIAIDSDILKKLIQLRITKLRIKIKKLEKDCFYIETHINTFLKKSVMINYDIPNKRQYGQQRIASIDSFERIKSSPIN